MADFKQMTLGQCAEFDKANGAKYRLTAWGKICKERQERGISRKAIRAKKKAQQSN